MKKIHYAWVICIACLWLYLCNMGLCSNIFTIYLPFLKAEGLSDSMGSTILSVRCLFSFLATFFVGIYYRRFSLRTGILLASLFGAVSPLVFCAAGSNALIYYLGAALAGIAYGFGCIYPAALLLSNWFHARMGLAVGISSAGSGITTMAFSPLFSSIALRFSLQTAFLAQAAFMLLSAAAVFFVVRDTPQEKSMTAYGDRADAQPTVQQGTSQPLPPLMLGLLGLMMLLNGGAGQAFSGHLAILATTSGYSTELAASIVSLFGLTLTLSKLAAGGIIDRIGTRKCSILLLSLFLAGCLLVLGMNGTDAFWCFAASALMGMGASVYNVGPPLWAGDLSAPDQYAATLKWLQIFYNLGGIVFSVVPGLIADHTAEYKSSYLLFAAMMLTSLLILLWAYRQRRK